METACKHEIEECRIGTDGRVFCLECGYTWPENLTKHFSLLKGGEEKMAFQKVSVGKGNSWDFKTNKVLEGALVAKREHAGQYDKWAYDVETKNGVVTAWGKANLDRQMATVNVGEVVRITWKGMEKTDKGISFHNFEVEVDR